jgi:hypothetical protein
MIRRLLGGMFVLVGLIVCLPALHNTLTRYCLSFLMVQEGNKFVVLSPNSAFMAKAFVVIFQVALIAIGGYLLHKSAPKDEPIAWNGDIEKG